MVDENRGEGKQGTGEEEVTKLRTQITEITGLMESMKTANEALTKQNQEHSEMFTNPDFLDAMEAIKNKGGAGGTIERTPEDLEPTNLDTLSGGKLVEYVSGQTNTALKQITDGMNKALTAINEKVGQLSVNMDLSVEQIKRPELKDFLANEEGLKRFDELSLKNPKWSVADIFDDIQKDEKLAEIAKVEAEDRKRAEEAAAYSEKPDGVAPLTAEGKEMTEDEILENEWTSQVGAGKMEIGI